MPNLYTQQTPQYRPAYRTPSAVARRGQALTVEHRELTADEKERERKDQLLRQARKRFAGIREYEAEMRQEMLMDFDFRANLQWDEGVRSERAQSGRPCLTVNRFSQVVSIIVNEIRQNRAGIQVNPVGNGADQETAQVLQGMTRHIELLSDADVAYDTAADHQVTAGRGWFRILIEWANDSSFDQEIKIRRIANPFSVYMDRDAQQPDYSDARYGFIVEDLDKAAFESQFPGFDFSPMRDFEGIGDFSDWYPENRCRVAEYFYVMDEPGVLHQLTDGTCIKGGDIIPDGQEIVLSRDVMFKKVKWAKLTARDVLEEREWPGAWIPIIPVLGNEFIIRGKREYAGIVRFARDPQRIYNYTRSAIVEAIALAPKSPWLVAEGQIENYERMYEQANIRNIPVLYYKVQTAANQQPVPPPSRINAEPPIMAMSNALGQAEADFEAATGIYRPQLGAPQSDQSGKAILARQKQGDTATFVYGDNQARAIKHCGRQIIGLVPIVYSEATTAHIVNPDQSRKEVKLNQPSGDFDNSGIERIYRVGADIGRYDVTVTQGPSYQSRRQEAATLLMQLVQSFPQFFGIAGDLILRNLDLPGNTELADRWKKTLPPALQDEGTQNGQQPQLPPEVQAMIQQLQQTIQKQQQMLQPKLLETMSRERIATADRESRERIAWHGDQTGIVKAEMSQKSKATDQMAADVSQRDWDSVQSELDRQHQAAMAAAQADHEKQLAQQQQQQAAQQQGAAPGPRPPRASYRSPAMQPQPTAA